MKFSKMKKVRVSKGKLAAVVAVCCIAIATPVFAFDEWYDYAIGPNDTETIARFVPGSSVLYLNSRPTSGGNLNVSLHGGGSGSTTFPYHTSRSPWQVNVNPSITLEIDGNATSYGTAGSLHVWSN